MAHFLEAAIGCVDTTSHNPEPARLHLAAKQVIFRKIDALVEAAEIAEFCRLKHHEHAGTEGAMQVGKVLKEIVDRVEQLIHHAAAAENVRCKAVEIF